MKLSIITVVKADPAGLKKTIISVNNQNYNEIEHVIINGDGCIETADVARKYPASGAVVISEADDGIYDAMNKGIRTCSGELITILNAGDFYVRSDAISEVIDLVKIESRKDFFFAPVLKEGIKMQYNPKALWWTFRIGTAHSVGFFVRRRVHDALGYYSLQYKCSADYDFFYRIHKNGYKGALLNTHGPIGEFVSGGHSSRFTYVEHLWEQAQIRLDNGQSPIVVYGISTCRLINEVRRNFIRRLRCLTERLCQAR